MSFLILFTLLSFICISFIELCFGDCFADVDLTSEKGHLFLNGKRFYMKGLSWFGFETNENVVHGLWAQDYKHLLDVVQSWGFNSMRLPFYLELLTNDPPPNSINFYQMNEDLKNLTSLQCLDKIIQAAATRGILIMLDLHSFKPGTYLEDGLWYDSTHPIEDVLAGWDFLINRYKNQWNVIAFDLKNEPFKATWNTGNNATDWNTASKMIGDHIHNQIGGSKYLIFVEGTASSPNCPDACFYGEDLMGVKDAPVVLGNKNKLVYSPHVYGPSVYPQPYFSDSNFPKNMPDIWNDHFGFVPNVTGNAITVGEWGGFLTGNDGVWMNAFVDYLLDVDHTDTFFWCLNPDSGDTGGLLGYDWVTPEEDKLKLIQRLVPNPTVITTKDNMICID